MLPSESRPLFSYENLEGEYTSWRCLWVLPMALLEDYTQAHVDNLGNVYVANDSGTMLYTITRAGVPTPHPDQIMHNWPGMWWGMNIPYTLGRKYVLAMDTITFQILNVYRRGTLIWTRSLVLDFPNMQFLSNWGFSPNGRYIVCTVSDIVTGWWRTVLLYEGVEP